MKIIEEKDIIVSVIVPIRNEEKYIEKCIQSITSQNYPFEKLEVIFIDGLSEDKTREIVNKYITIYPSKISLLINPNKTVPYAMNIGIENSKGRYIVRLDAHSEYNSDYISKCVSTLEDTDADNVGGLALTKGVGIIGENFANVLSSKFGVGNSSFRTNASSGYVDTVPFGAFKRETFQKFGLFDERLIRNQDYELNYRIRNKGGKIFLNSDIKLTYYCRNTIKGILKQSYENGKWNIITSKLCPGTMSIRHFIPLLFFLSLIILPILTIIFPIFSWLLVGELGIYLLLALLISFMSASRTIYIPLLFCLFPIFHISYGFGSFVGLFFEINKLK
jgi:glycosyltransferase involved in cell wall biosynthesis